MSDIWYFLYNIIILPLFRVTVKIISLFNPKVKKGLIDRKRLFENLIIDLADLDRSKKLYWFHSSSMGEFEQAKPIIESLKSTSNVNVLVTFFSPSGYENSKRYPYADVISYLPFDNPNDIKRFIKLVKPSIVILMRYDIWPNLVWQLKKRNIILFIVDATMQDKSKRKWFFSKRFHNALYKYVDRILTVSENDKSNFLEFNISPDKIKSVGDTRYDRVYGKSREAKEKKLFRDGIFEGKKIFVMGSSWPSDENVVFPAFKKLARFDENVILIVAPHEPTLIHIENIESEFRGVFKTIRFSYMNNYSGERVIIIDSIGILLSLYYHADAAYVGGSFRQGIHNVLEPAVYGIPVVFGPKYTNSQEAVKLSEIGGAVSINNSRKAYRQLRMLFRDENYRNKMGEICQKFVNGNLGATEKIINEINRIVI